jgi:hypothetical protein
MAISNSLLAPVLILFLLQAIMDSGSWMGFFGMFILDSCAMMFCEAFSWILVYFVTCYWFVIGVVVVRASAGKTFACLKFNSV